MNQNDMKYIPVTDPEHIVLPQERITPENGMAERGRKPAGIYGSPGRTDRCHGKDTHYVQIQI